MDMFYKSFETLSLYKSGDIHFFLNIQILNPKQSLSFFKKNIYFL